MTGCDVSVEAKTSQFRARDPCSSSARPRRAPLSASSRVAPTHSALRASSIIHPLSDSLLPPGWGQGGRQTEIYFSWRSDRLDVRRFYKRNVLGLASDVAVPVQCVLARSVAPAQWQR